jgi:hypothetical protein
MAIPHTMRASLYGSFIMIISLYCLMDPSVLNQAASEDPSPPYSHSVEPEEDIVRVSIDSYGGNWVD